MMHSFSCLTPRAFGWTRSAKVALSLCCASVSLAGAQAAQAEGDDLADLAIPVTPSTLPPKIEGIAPSAQMEKVEVAGGGQRVEGVGNSARFIALSQMREGVAPEELWQKHLLTAEDIFAILESNDRLTQDERNEKLRRDLAHVLVDHTPEQVKDVSKLKLNVRVALARYYSSVGDVRTVDIAEGLLKELDRKPKDADPWPQLWGVILLAKYYEKTEEWQKAGETWERALGYQSNVGWWQAGVRVDAARAYKQTDAPENQKKAEELYAQVPKFGNNADTGMAIYDQASALVEKKQQVEAQSLLQRSLGEIKVEWVKVGLLSLLSDSYLSAGETKMARLTAQNALDLHATLKNAPKDAGFKYQVQRAQEVIARCQKHEVSKN